MSMEVTPHNGCLWTVPGCALLDDQTMGPQQNLLHVLVVCPGLAARSRGTETSYGARVHRYVSDWHTSDGVVSVAVDWDKRTDRVTIAGRGFVRNVGNVFVVRREPSSRLVSFQLPSLGPNAGPEETLRHIQHHLSNDTVIAAVQLPERE
jgi:hypothetical protein